MLRWLVLVAMLQTAPSTRPAADPLPAAWHGRWVGEMTAQSTRGAQRLGMELHILPAPDRPPGTLTFTIVYAPPGVEPQTRAYHLLPTGRANEFLIDEGGPDPAKPLLLPTTLFGDTLVSQFEVEGQVLTAQYELAGDVIRVTIASAAPSGSAQSGVTPHQTIALQRAELKRQTN
jgi:hypothetical protein